MFVFLFNSLLLDMAIPGIIVIVFKCTVQKLVKKVRRVATTWKPLAFYNNK